MFSPSRLEEAVVQVRSADPVIDAVIDRVGPCALRPQRDRFKMLVRSIISQQISTGAANSIFERLCRKIQPRTLDPAAILDLDLDELRSVGVSPQKASYLRDLATKIDGGQLHLSQLGRYRDEKIIAELTQVKGIGVWTAQMFLIFSLVRLDVLPVDDLGLRTAMKNLYRLNELPNRRQAEDLGRCWRPYATIGSWYCWRSLESQDIL